MNTTLTAIEGIKVGHWTNLDAATGCTVILCPAEGCIASGSVRGSAPGSRETALLEPEKTVEHVHAILLSGGSAFGLAAATGVVRWLEQQGRGFKTPFANIPIVPAAVIFDLGVGRADVRPDEESGYVATQAASAKAVVRGRVGAGTGASCGKFLGFEHAHVSGLGSALYELDGAKMAALAVANPSGNIVNPETAELVAGALATDNPQSINTYQASTGSNTTLVVVATDAPISKTEAKILADSAHIGIAQATRPSHTLGDGDSSFVLSTGTAKKVSLMTLTVATQKVVAAAIIDAARSAK